MTHANAPLTPVGRLRLVRRCQSRPIAHVAAEAGVSRQCLGKWVARYRAHGEPGLLDRSSRPTTSPNATPPQVVARIIALRKKKWSAHRISDELSGQGVMVAVCTVSRILRRHRLHRLDWLDVDGTPLRRPGKIIARYPGHMIHVDVKKVGRIPPGGGWRVHGKGSGQDKSAQRAKAGGVKAGYTYLHSAVDGFSRLAYTEAHDDETVRTDNGSCYRAGVFTRTVGSFAARHHRIKPYTPRHNGKVERYQQTIAREVLYAAPYDSEEHRRQHLAVWQVHYNYHRPHTAAGDNPPASRLKTSVTNVMPSYTWVCPANGVSGLVG